jgi:hypothetical protein
MEQFDFKEFDWERYYTGAKELIPNTVPRPLGNHVQVTFFVDAAFANDLVTRRSTEHGNNHVCQRHTME